MVLLNSLCSILFPLPLQHSFNFMFQLSSSEFVVLDSSRSVFYTLPIFHLSDGEKNGYIDGEPGVGSVQINLRVLLLILDGYVYVAFNKTLLVTSNLVGIYPDRAARWVRGENCNILQFFEPVKFWVLGTGGFHVCLGHSHLGLQKRTCVYPLLLLVSYCVLHWINQHGLLFYPNYVDWKAADPFIYQAKTWKHGHNQIWQSIVPVSLYSSFTLVPDSNTVGPKGSNNDFISLVDSDINNPCVRQVNKTFADQLKGI
ncbi:LOW QUALITY PROTEIN: hypothetical protein NC653_011007 [Populus alba x Populus x berolinensis]|uniref:Uncharacterized protein n=1 Tax=Populus alba x Populus x berolinensis TaxID=444605 RepID=A0AAD6R198_9ROSI|nr:LOW QUALITY PROTEIN: hypothetical protein NC653_011007 [Populus alba x Populus x berolinensis]